MTGILLPGGGVLWEGGGIVQVTGAGGGSPAPVGGLTTLSFAGPAGPPTGASALTLAAGSSASNFQLTGSGALTLQGVQDVGTFTSLGALGDGIVTATYAPGTPNVNMALYFGQGYSIRWWVYLEIWGPGGRIGMPGYISNILPKASLGFAVSNGKAYFMVDGKIVYVATDTVANTHGPLGIGGYQQGTNPTLLGSIAVNSVAYVVPLPQIGAPTAVTASTAAPVGAHVFALALAVPGYGIPTMSLSGPDAALFRPGDVNAGVSGVVTARTPLTPGTKQVTATLTDVVLGTSTVVPLTIPVVAGTLLPPSAITATISPGLTNDTPAGVIGHVSISGMSGTPVLSLWQMGGGQVGLSKRFALAADGTLSSTMLMSAGTETVTVVATNGVDYCTAPLPITAAAAVGPVLDIGPGQTYSYYSQAASYLWEGDVLGTQGLGGATLRVHANPANPRYWLGQLNGGSTIDAGGNDRSISLTSYAGYKHPLTIQGVPDPATGSLPIVGGASGYYGLGCVVINQNRDWSVSNVEIRDGVTGGNNIAGIRRGAETQGDGTVSNVYLHNNNNGYLGTSIGKVTMSSVLVAMTGTGDAGYTHGVYADHVALTCTNFISYGVNGGHDLKSRSLTTTVTHFTLGHPLLDRNSACVDLSNGGNATFTDGQIIKSPMCQNKNMIQYGRDTNIGGTNHLVNPGSTLGFDGVTFINLFPPGIYGSGAAAGILIADYNGQPMLDIDTGLPPQCVFNNCKVFGLTLDHFIQQAGQPALTAWPPGVTLLDEPPPVNFVSPLLNGLVPPAPAPWSDPNGSNTNFFNYDSNGLIETGLHELRVLPGAAANTGLCQLRAWGITSRASTDPGFNPWATGATWAVLPTAGASSTFFDVSASGVVHTVGTLAGAPVLSWIVVQATSSNGLYKTVAVLPIIISNTPALTGATILPAALTIPQRPLGQEALGTMTVRPGP